MKIISTKTCRGDYPKDEKSYTISLQVMVSTQNKLQNITKYLNVSINDFKMQWLRSVSKGSNVFWNRLKKHNRIQQRLRRQTQNAIQTSFWQNHQFQQRDYVLAKSLQNEKGYKERGWGGLLYLFKVPISSLVTYIYS